MVTPTAYQLGRDGYNRCVGHHLGLMGNPTGASAERVAEYRRGYADAKRGA